VPVVAFKCGRLRLTPSSANRVKRGETLASIARLYQTSVASVKQWNRLRSNSLRVGQQLTIVATRHLVATN
jgi:LysM repeat protein